MAPQFSFPSLAGARCGHTEHAKGGAADMECAKNSMQPRSGISVHEVRSFVGLLGFTRETMGTNSAWKTCVSIRSASTCHSLDLRHSRVHGRFPNRAKWRTFSVAACVVSANGGAPKSSRRGSDRIVEQETGRKSSSCQHSEPAGSTLPRPWPLRMRVPTMCWRGKTSPVHLHALEATLGAKRLLKSGRELSAPETAQLTRLVIIANTNKMTFHCLWHSHFADLKSFDHRC